jgi:hypothetical protein
MDRMLALIGRRLSPLAAGLLLLAGSSGCVSLLTTVAYLIKGTTIDAEYDGLEKKTVAIIVQPPASMGPHEVYGAQEVALRLGDLFRANVSKVKVIDQSLVDRWMDENGADSENLLAIGKALKAQHQVQMVVCIKLESFSLHASASVYQGRADYEMEVLDMEQDGKVVFSKSPPRCEYPATGGRPADVSVPQFRRQYADVLAEEIGRVFYAHDAVATFARD